MLSTLHSTLRHQLTPSILLPVLQSPQFNDHISSALASKHNLLVISLAYRKAPTHQFPSAVDDIRNIILACVTDPTLPIDTDNIVIGGFSAGGNMSFVTAQSPEIKANCNVRGIVGFFPVLDWTLTVEEKVATKKQTGKKDMLAGMVKLFEWAYIPSGTDKRDLRLSVTFAPRETLPNHIYLLGAEHDLLCNEAQVMAEKLAGVDGGSRELIEGVPEGEGWKSAGIRWEKARALEHGWTHYPIKGNPKEEERRKAYLNAVIGRVGNWLNKEVFV